MIKKHVICHLICDMILDHSSSKCTRVTHLQQQSMLSPPGGQQRQQVHDGDGVAQGVRARRLELRTLREHCVAHRHRLAHQ